MKSRTKQGNDNGQEKLTAPTISEREHDHDEFEFLMAMDQYKRDNRRPFPTWSEVLEVLHALGYRKPEQPT